MVFSNECLGYIVAEQLDDSHQPLSGVDLPETDWATVAKGMGAMAFTVRTKAEFKAAMVEAQQTDLPVVIDVKLTHAMPLSTNHMFLDKETQDPKLVDEYVEKYQAQALKPFSYFLKAAKEAHGEEIDAFSGASAASVEDEADNQPLADTTTGASEDAAEPSMDTDATSGASQH